MNIYKEGFSQGLNAMRLNIGNIRDLFLLLTAGIFFRIQLEISYTHFLSPIFSYAGFIVIENTVKYIESWALFIFTILLLPRRGKKPSDYLVLLAFFGFIAPLLTYYGEADQNRATVYIVLFQYYLITVFRFNRNIIVPIIGNKIILVKYISIIGLCIATSWMLYRIGLSNFSFNIETEYESREVVNDLVYTGFMGYIVSWATTVCSAFLLILSLSKRKFFICLLIVLLHIFWFGITTHKAIALYPLQVICIYIILRSTNLSAVIPIALSSVVLISQIVFQLSGNYLLSTLFVRRVLFVPSHLTFTYFEFFNNNPYVYWSNSFLSWLYDYPYGVSTALLIGNYLNDSTLWANNSFFSTGFMHAGIAGVILYGVASGLILSILDSFFRKGIPIWMVVTATIVPFFTLFTSADLTTTLLSSGLGFAILLLSLCGSKKYSKN